MTEWKPKAGEDAVVRVQEVFSTGRNHVRIEGSNVTIPVSTLRPLPTALSAEDAAVLQAADEWADEFILGGRPRDFMRPEAKSLVQAAERRRSTAPAAVAVFKVGDRVRVVAPTRMKRAGIVVRDLAHEERPFVVDFADNGGGWGRFDASELEPAPDPADVPQDRAWQPKVGDRVRTKWVRDISGEPIRGVVDRISTFGDVIYKIANGGGLGSALADWLESDPEPATPRDTTPLRDAVVEAVRVYREKRKEYRMNPTAAGDGAISNARKALDAAHDALLAAEAPPDPVAELRDAAEALDALPGRYRHISDIAQDGAFHDAINDVCAIATRLRAALSALGDRGPG